MRPKEGMHNYFSSAPFVTCTIIEFLKQLDLEQALTRADQEQIPRQYVKILNSLGRNQVLPHFARDHAKKLKKELSSKEVALFWDSIIDREKGRATEEHDLKLLEQVRKKHVSLGKADADRVQQENEKGIDR